MLRVIFTFIWFNEKFRGIIHVIFAVILSLKCVSKTTQIVVGRNVFIIYTRGGQGGEHSM